MAQYQGNNNNNRNNGPKSGASSGSTPTAGAKRTPDFDIVAVDDNGEIVMEYSEAAGKEVSKNVGAVWLSDKEGAPAFIKFSDGRKAKMFAKKSKPAGSSGGSNVGGNAQASAASVRQPAAPAQQPSQPARRPGGSPFANRSKQ